MEGFLCLRFKNFTIITEGLSSRNSKKKRENFLELSNIKQSLILSKYKGKSEIVFNGVLIYFSPASSLRSVSLSACKNVFLNLAGEYDIKDLPNRFVYRFQPVSFSCLKDQI